MRRAKAILVVISLLGTPLALLARGAVCGERMCCTKMCCAHHDTTIPHKSSGDGGCGHEGAPPASSCVMKAACNHTQDFGLISPLPPTQLSAMVDLPLPASIRASLTGFASHPIHGFRAAPFEPPRT